MPGKPARPSAFCRRHVGVKISGMLTAKRDALSIWREMRIRCLTLEAGEPASTTTGTRYRPNVVGISKGNLGRAHRRRAQQASLRIRRLYQDQTADCERREQLETSISQAAIRGSSSAAAGLSRQTSLRHVVVPPDRSDDCATLLA